MPIFEDYGAFSVFLLIIAVCLEEVSSIIT